MAFERAWSSVPPRALTANGDAFGNLTVTSTTGFRVKQVITLKAATLPDLSVQVKKVLSPTQMIIGAIDQKIVQYQKVDISAYTVALAANVSAGEQKKNDIPEKDHYSAIYEADPVVADRVILVDDNGNFINEQNPLPTSIEGTISIGQVEVIGENGNTIEPNTDGSINVNIVTAPTANKIKNVYAEALSVASGIETTIVTYVVPLSLTEAFLQRVSVSGENVGRFRVFLNGTVIDTRRTYYGADFSQYFEFAMGSADGTFLSPGDIVTVKILHTKPMVGDFESRIQVLEII